MPLAQFGFPKSVAAVDPLPSDVKTVGGSLLERLLHERFWRFSN